MLQYLCLPTDVFDSLLNDDASLPIVVSLMNIIAALSSPSPPISVNMTLLSLCSLSLLSLLFSHTLEILNSP